MDPTYLSQVLIPKPYQNIAELLGTLGQLLILAERSNDENLKERYIKLFDVMFKGLDLYLDKEFYQVGPNNIVSIKNKVDKPLIFTNNPSTEEDPEIS